VPEDTGRSTAAGMTCSCRNASQARVSVARIKAVPDCYGSVDQPMGLITVNLLLRPCSEQAPLRTLNAQASWYSPQDVCAGMLIPTRPSG
jgi:hypothetical protein